MSKPHLGTGPSPPENGKEGGTGGLPRSVGVPTEGPGAEPSPKLSKPDSILNPDNTFKGYISLDCIGGPGETVTGSIGTVKPGEPRVVDEVLDRRSRAFESFLVRVGRSRSTAASYRKAVVRCAQAIGKDPVEWDTEDVKTLMASPTWAGWSAGTRHTHKAALVSYWKANEVEAPRCLEWDMMRGPRVSGTSQRTEDLRKQAPTPQEVQRVRSFCRSVILESPDPDNVYSAFCALLVANYGLRCVDTASLRCGDIRLSERVLHIHKGKGQKARDIYMDILLEEEVLNRFMSARASILRTMKARDPDCVTVLTKLGLSEDALAGTPLLFVRDPNGLEGGDLSKCLQTMIPRVVSLALGRHVNAHAFRHAKAFELLDQKVAIETVAQYLGHANIQQTMEYRWAEVDAQRSAFARINPGASEGVRPTQTPSASSGASKVSEAIAALASLQTQGLLSVEAFAAAVAALGK